VSSEEGTDCCQGQRQDQRRKLIESDHTSGSCQWYAEETRTADWFRRTHLLLRSSVAPEAGAGYLASASGAPRRGRGPWRAFAVRPPGASGAGAVWTQRTAANGTSARSSS